MAALAFGACATIHSVESTTDTPIAPSIEHEVEAGSLRYEVASAAVRGYELDLVVQRSESCATVTTPRVHRRRHVDREVDATASRATWGIALGALGAGVYGYVDAERVAAQAMDGTTEAQVREYAAALVAVALIATVVGTIDAVRAKDVELDDGVIDGRPARERARCLQGPVSDAEVRLELAHDHVVVARTDARGAASLSFLEVPEAGLADADTRVALVVDGQPARFAGFDASERALVREHLLGEPRSRLAAEMREKRRAACQRGLDAARASAPEELASAQASWSAARSACGELWTAALDDERIAFDARGVLAQCRPRLEVAAAAFTDDTGTTVGDMIQELAALRETCSAPESVAWIRALDAQLAASVQRNAREAARAEAASRAELQRARRQRSFAAPSWPEAAPRTCCKVCSKGKACGDSCIARSKTCHVGVGCACD
jgi:hypothetical protein